MDLPGDGGSIGEAELRDGDWEPHDGEGGGARPAVHLDVHWRVRQALGLSPVMLLMLYTSQAGS